MNLTIPQKKLTDTFSLEDFQSDFNTISTFFEGVAKTSTINLLNTFRDEDCSLITTINNKTILIDCGEKFSETGIISRLDKLGIKQLDYFIITHFHSDHAGNSAKIIEKYKPKTCYYRVVDFDKIQEPVIWGTKELYLAFMDACSTYNINAIKLTQDTTLYLSPKENIKLLNTSYVDYADYNSSSMMVLYNVGMTNVLFGGDVTTYVLEQYKHTIPQLSLLKAPHHGGYVNNVNESFITNTRPNITHINGLGLPYSNETANMCKWACNSKIYIDGERQRSTYGYLVSEIGLIPSDNLIELSYSDKMFDYNGNWYLCSNDGNLIGEGIVSHKGNLFYVENWKIVTSPMWIKYNGYDYYVKEGGYIARDEWKQSENIETPNRWYRLGSDGRMLKDTSIVMDNKIYAFNNEGIASPLPI